MRGTTGLQATGITIEGAGMWYSTIYRDVPLPNSTPLAAAFSVTSCRMEDIHIDSNALSRAEVDGGGGAMDTTGTNWLANGDVEPARGIRLLGIWHRRNSGKLPVHVDLGRRM